MSRRVLFDRNVPRPSREHLTGCIVRTTDDEGWSALTNGELLAAAERSGFDVMVTGDNNLRYQQNLSGRALALVVLSNPAWPVVRHGLAFVVDAVNRAVPGSYEDVSFARPPRRRRPFTRSL